MRHPRKHRIEQPLTRKVKLFTDPTRIQAAALKFSIDHQIAESKRWANMRDEDGLGAGGAHSLRTSRKISRTKTGSRNWYTDGTENRMIESGEKVPKGWKPGRVCKKHTEATKELIRSQRKGAVFSKAHRDSLRKAAIGRLASQDHREAIGRSKKGCAWFHDGNKSFLIKPNDPRISSLGLLEGRLPMNWFNDGTSRNFLIPPTDPKIRRLRLVPGRL